jgi:hypothetical protein
MKLVIFTHAERTMNKIIGWNRLVSPTLNSCHDIPSIVSVLRWPWRWPFLQVKSSEIPNFDVWIPQESPRSPPGVPQESPISRRPACWDAPSAAPEVAGWQLRLHGARSLTWPSNCGAFQTQNRWIHLDSWPTPNIRTVYIVLIMMYKYMYNHVYTYIWVQLVIAVSCAIVVCKWNCCGEFMLTIWMFFPCDCQKSKWRVCVDLWYYGSFAPMDALL